MEALWFGEAEDDKERFRLKISPVPNGFRLDIDYRGDGPEGETGAGIWPSIEKAKEVAEATAKHLLHGSKVRWSEAPNAHSSGR